MTKDVWHRARSFPPGTYRITKTLVFQGPTVGCLVIGHGRDTRLVWDGPQGGRMSWSNGVAYSRYVGLTWDGRGKAAVGFDHAAQERFETEIRREHEAFRNFTEYGIRVGYQQKVASAEILYRNCLFENCNTGLAFLTFNDYDNTIDGCEFRNCGTGVLDNKGNFYARNCHFEGSRQVDFSIGSEHGSSIRRCTSVGSKRFIEERGTIVPLTIQDCHVAGWTDPDGAVHLHGSPVLMFDCSFPRPPSARPPVKLSNPAQKLLLSNNRPTTIDSLVQATTAAKLDAIPPGQLGGVISSAEQRFLQDSATVPGKVFDAVIDFGAKADGKDDDTAAIQAAIDAARQAGRGALAYLPLSIRHVPESPGHPRTALRSVATGQYRGRHPGPGQPAHHRQRSRPSIVSDVVRVDVHDRRAGSRTRRRDSRVHDPAGDPIEADLAGPGNPSRYINDPAPDGTPLEKSSQDSQIPRLHFSRPRQPAQKLGCTRDSP